MLLSMVLTGCGKTAEETPEAPAEEPTTEQTAETFDTSELAAKLSRPIGDLAEMVPVNNVETVSAEEEAAMDRAMRAYTPSADSLLINNAKNFYYYSMLDATTQAAYDAILMLAEDPVTKDNYQMILSEDAPDSEEFYNTLGTAFFALIYDHPELFWLYNSSETELMFGSSGTMMGNSYPVYVYFSNPVPDYEKQMKDFYKAADDFLADIDTTKSEADVALAIHDKLVNLVTYDMDVLNNLGNSGKNLAHTAYGCLVANSEGKANYAVCDGYSLAYEYLLQQAGLEAAVIGGVAGNDPSSVGGHAWSIVKIDGKWYEVDSTWNDVGTIENDITPDINGYEYYMEALKDPEYRDKMEHYLYRVTTDEITNYVPDQDYYAYFTKDGLYKFSLVGSSVHIRDTEESAGVLGRVMSMAPIAQ